MLHYSYRRYSGKRAKKWRTINARWNNKLRSIRAGPRPRLPRENNQCWRITKSWPRIVWGENLQHGNTDQKVEEQRKKEKSWTYRTPWKLTTHPIQTELQEQSRKHIRVVRLTTENREQKRRTVVISQRDSLEKDQATAPAARTSAPAARSEGPFPLCENNAE